MTDIDNTWLELRAKLERYVRNKVEIDVSEDLVHDILLRVLQNKDKLASADDPLAWIFTIAKNRITDHYRKQSRASAKNDQERIDAEKADCQSMPDCVDTDFALWLRPIADGMEAKYREALLLVDFSQKAQASAAEEVGISLSAMKSRVQRARSMLKSELLNCCAIEVDRFNKPIDYKKNEVAKNKSCC